MQQNSSKNLDQEQNISEPITSIRNIIKANLSQQGKSNNSVSGIVSGDSEEKNIDKKTDNVLLLTDIIDENNQRIDLQQKKRKASSEKILLRQEYIEGDGLLSDRVKETYLNSVSELTSITENKSNNPEKNKVKIDSAEVGNCTVDQLVRNILKPILKEWLDTNLPSIIKTVVTEQMEKIEKKNI